MTTQSKLYLIVLGQLMVALVALSLAAIAAPAGNESLGGKLLDDLNPSLYGPPAASPKSDQPPGRAVPSPPSFQKRIVPDLSDPISGEDLGQSSESAALARIEQQMGTAHSLLRQAKAPDRASKVQQQIVAGLDALIEQLSKQCQGGSCQSTGQSQKPSQRSQAGSAKPAAKPGHGGAPARDSTTRIGMNDPGAADFGDREQLLKDFWGHLPLHAREQLLQTQSDEFLPQYELEIEQYYKRLSEESGAATDAR